MPSRPAGLGSFGDAMLFSSRICWPYPVHGPYLHFYGGNLPSQTESPNVTATGLKTLEKQGFRSPREVLVVPWQSGPAEPSCLTSQYEIRRIRNMSP